MNRNFIIDTTRIRCEPLAVEKLDLLDSIIKTDAAVGRFFSFEDLPGFFAKIDEYMCFPMVIYRHLPTISDVDSKIIGYINGYDYCNGRMLIEFFIAEDFRRNGYAKEAIHAFTHYMSFSGYSTFKFHVDEQNCACISLMEHLHAEHCVEEDFVSETSPGHICNYRMYELTLKKW